MSLVLIFPYVNCAYFCFNIYHIKHVVSRVAKFRIYWQRMHLNVFKEPKLEMLLIYLAEMIKECLGQIIKDIFTGSYGRSNMAG